MALLTDLPGDWRLLPRYAGRSVMVAVRLMPNLSMRRGTVLGQQGQDGPYGPYSASAIDGRSVARILLGADVATDASGFITLASLEVGKGRMADRLYDRTECYLSGTFACEDLTGLDDAAVGQLGRLIQGVASRGILEIG